jgi:hypothetical protein
MVRLNLDFGLYKVRLHTLCTLPRGVGQQTELLRLVPQMNLKHQHSEESLIR